MTSTASTPSPSSSSSPDSAGPSSGPDTGPESGPEPGSASGPETGSGAGPASRDGLVTLGDLRAAARRIAGVAVRTPLVPCLAAGTANPLWLKPENLQPIGAFKIRGAYNAIASLGDEQRARGVVAHSSGNHAQAVAHAASLLGTRAVVVMPDTAPAVKVDATRALGAEVVLVTPDRRDSAALELADAHGYALIPPYDDPRVVAGQGTVGLEIAEDRDAGLAGDLGAVLVPVSGGGLLSGVATAVKLAAPGVRVIGVEPELAGDAAESWRTGRLTTWPVADTYRTLADGLRTTSLGHIPWAHVRAYADDIITVTERQIRDAVRFLARHARLVAEPSGAVATAGYLANPELAGPARSAVAVVSGGNVDPAAYAALLAGGD